MGGGAIADDFFGEEGLLANAVGDFGKFALVGADGGEVVALADEIEGAKGFPDLFVAGVHGSDLAPSRHSRSRGHGEGANAPADGGAHFDGLLPILRANTGRGGLSQVRKSMKTLPSFVKLYS